MAAITSNGTGGGVWSAGSSWTGGVAPTEGDTCQIRNGDTITLDTTVIVGADSATPAIDILNGGKFYWDNLGVDVLTLKGNLYIRTGGILDFEGTTNATNTLTIKLNYSATPANNKYGVNLETGSTFISRGYNKVRPYDVIATTAASGQKIVKTTNDNSTNWLVNDEVVLTTTVSFTTGNRTDTKTISSFSGTDITLDTNLSYEHLATYGYVSNLTRNITWIPYNTTYGSAISSVGVNTIICSWSRFSNMGKSNTYTFYFTSGPTPFNLNYCVIDNTSSYSFATYGWVNNTEVSYNVWYNSNWLWSVNGVSFHHNMTIQTGLCGGGGNTTKVYNNIWAYNTSAGGCFYNWGAMSDMEYYNNICIAGRVGLSTYASAFPKVNCHNNYFYGCSVCIDPTNSIDAIYKDNVFGDATLPSITAVNVGGYINLTLLTNNTGSWTNTYTNLPSVAGSKVNFSNMGAANIDFTLDTYGVLTKVGTGLSDTTAHTAGGYAMRFESKSSTNRLEWTQTIPTGNIQNKSMTVGVWCKINNANYYSATHQLPRLTINYDNGTTAYCQAQSSTDWQLLFVTFTPTTTYGQITATLSTMTDQTGSNAYVYFDDYVVLYPAGYQLNLGAMDLWANGLPVSPTISTNLSAQDVWSALDNIDYGDSTMGNRVKKLKNASYIVDGEIII